MKKRLIALCLVLLLLIPEMAFAGVEAYLNQQMATRSGPGTKYTEELGTLPSNTEITVTAQVETAGTVWYQVEFYKNGRWYRAYTGKKRVNAYGNIPWESVNYSSDITIASTTAYYGPGSNYAARKMEVSRNTEVRVFGVEGEWALCEYRENNKWARGYINVNHLEATAAVPVTPSPVPTQKPTATPRPTATPAPKYKEPNNILDLEKRICITYYGEEYSYAGHDEYYALLVGELPVMSYFDGVPCIRSHTYVYSGPGEHYWRRYNPGSGYAYTGTLDTNLRIYGKENGWILIRYPSDANGGYRYGWVIPAAISAANQARTPKVDFVSLPAMTTRYLDATDDPDRSIQYGGTTESAHIKVTALAFLDEERDWVYCEYKYDDGSRVYDARGFLPADGLRLLEQ
ncbi:MAG: SH3 domain-containing protein [Clostridiales bacterium]|nr:SH3 domain-containing protein [Clostridiales bacterium]